MAAKLVFHPTFYRRLRHYRDRIGLQDGRPQTAVRFVLMTQRVIKELLSGRRTGHPARFESADLADILRVSVPGFAVFAVFYRWDGRTLTVITLEHTAQDLPSRLAAILE